MQADDKGRLGAGRRPQPAAGMHEAMRAMFKHSRSTGRQERRPAAVAARLAGALALALALVACQADEMGYGYGPKDKRPVSPKTQAMMAQLDMSSSSPVLMRIFKEENAFEVWKKDRAGRYALLKTYEICKWSGDLGPKVREGDRQAPEGFYTITPGLMNPKSDWYLAFNTGFPNAYDRANGRTGSALMVHGSCSSRGCYAMTDPQIQEIYALARDAFKGGQRSFQLQAFPFRMTAENMARHWKDPSMPFWKMLKEGYDTFELTHLEPKVDVCGRKYVFNAEPDQPLNAAMACPALNRPADLLASLAAKAKADETKAEVLYAALEEKRQANEEKQIMLAAAEEKRKREAEERRIAAESYPGVFASLFGSSAPAGDVAAAPVIVPPTGAPVPAADPRGPAPHMLAQNEPMPQITGSTGPGGAPESSGFSFSRLFAFASREPRTATPIIQPAAPATAAPVRDVAAPPAAPAAVAVPSAPAAVAAPVCTPAGAAPSAGTPPCPAAPQPAGATSLAEAPAPSGLFGHLRSWF